MGLLDALGGDTVQALFDQSATDAPMTHIDGNRQMVQIRAAAVMSAEDGSNQSAAPPRHDTQTGIVRQISRGSLTRISVTQTDAGGAFPEGEDFVVIGDRHL